MKKLLALVLALIMVLTAVAVVAEGAKSPASPEDNQKTDVKPAPAPGGFGPAPAAGFSVVLTDDNDETKEIIKKMTEAGKEKVLTVIPDDQKEELPAEFTNVNEISTWKVEGDTTGVEKAEVKFTFTSPYKVDEEVYLFLSVPQTEGKEWILLKGKVNDKSEVVVEFTKEILEKLKFEPFVVVAVNKPEA